MGYPQDTAPIRDEERFDEARLETFLRAAVPDIDPGVAVEFEQFPGGKANLTYLARAGDFELVVRRPPLGPTAPGSHDMAREHKVLSRLWSVYPRAPRAFAFCDDPEVIGKPFFVMERRRGIVIREDWPPDFPTSEAVRRRLAEQLVDTLAELHLVEYEEIGLGDLGRPDGFVARQVDGWTSRWHLAKTTDVPAVDRLAELLAGAIPRPQRARLLHNDFKLDNTMVDYTGEVVAVFDWDMATLGDPLVDLGTALAYWADPTEPAHLVFGDSSVTLAPYLSRGDVAERYARVTGLDLSHLDFYEALAMFRLTVIIQQIYVRYVRGQTSDERFAPLGEIVPLLAEVGLERGAGLRS